MSRNPHTQLVKAIVDYLELQPGCFAWKAPVMAGKVDGRWVKGGKKGCADVLCCWYGRFLAFEAKTGTGRLNKNQREFKADFEATGGIWVTVRRLEQVADMFLSREARW